MASAQRRTMDALTTMTLLSAASIRREVEANHQKVVAKTAGSDPRPLSLPNRQKAENPKAIPEARVRLVKAKFPAEVGRKAIAPVIDSASIITLLSADLYKVS